MAKPSSPVLGFEAFRRLIAAELQLDAREVAPQSSFVEDLLVDSIRMVDLMLRLDQMGIGFPPEAAWEIRTVEDAYRCYVKAAEARGQASAGEAAGRAAQQG